MGLQSKLVVYAAIGGLLAMMGGFVLYASQDNPALEQVEIELQKVELVNVNTIENKVELGVVFLVKNPSDKTFTVPLINYELYANGIHVGAGQYSTEDIAMPGRAAFYGGVEIPLKNKFFMVENSENSEVYRLIVSEENPDFTAEGVITVETAWSLIEKEFTA